MVTQDTRNNPNFRTQHFNLFQNIIFLTLETSELIVSMLFFLVAALPVVIFAGFLGLVVFVCTPSSKDAKA